ncbi:MAG: zinc-ribbon domain-containing protein, partial [Bryobacteraceae bacterium]
MDKCPSCGHRVPKDAGSCPACGAPLHRGLGDTQTVGVPPDPTETPKPSSKPGSVRRT